MTKPPKLSLVPPRPRENRRGHGGLDSVLQDRVIDALAKGNYVEVAVASAGMTMAEFSEARRWGAARERPQELTEGEWQNAKAFSREVDAKMASAEMALVASLRTIASGEGKGAVEAAKFLLERGHGERWGRKDKQEVEHRMVLDPSKLNDEELVERLRQLGFYAELPKNAATAALPPRSRDHAEEAEYEPADDGAEHVCDPPTES